MAATAFESQLRRYLPLLVSLRLIAGAATARAEDIEPSHYVPVVGESFFLLTDGTFGSDEEARVRLEAPKRLQFAFEPYDGIDIIVYRVPKPLELLQAQKNLHRPEIQSEFRGEGTLNALRYTWDVWFKKSRLIWQRILPTRVREAATAALPTVKQIPPYTYQTVFRPELQYGKLKGFDLVTQFRYPLWQAKPIQPPGGTALAGSSSEFIKAEEGNVYIPIGKQKPGLYVVEAVVGKFRASTYVFIADTLAVTKVAKSQAFVWTVRKRDGAVAPKVKLRFLDGVGVFASGDTDQDGIFVADKAMPERSYLLGEDESGGVFVSENYYYDSELYGLKSYLFTDRPLYQPGDRVNVKAFLREFADSSTNKEAGGTDAKLTLLDPLGSAVATNPLKVGPPSAGGSSFKLADSASSGGYTLRLAMADKVYDGSFRVQSFTRPHYQMEFLFPQETYRIGEPIDGALKLTYLNGDPVVGADVELLIRAQAVTMVEGEVRALGRFPRKLSEDRSVTDAQGMAKITLAPFNEATRIAIRARTADQSSYRAMTNKELLVLGSLSPVDITSDKLFTQANEDFALHFVARRGAPGAHAPVPATWEALRLEDRSKLEGTLAGVADATLRLPTPGTWQITVFDGEKGAIGTVQHWVRGEGLKVTPGSLTVVLDHDDYQAGQTAKVFISFSEPTEQALLTLERDGVHERALLTKGADWIKTSRISDTQWTAEIPIVRSYSPNVTLSVAYARNGVFTFQNKGLKVRVAEIKVDYTLAKDVYGPGEDVRVELAASIDGKPSKAHFAISVVDETIYAMQPEIAPTILDFFYHARRNQVRTWSSLQFHAFDSAKPGDGVYPQTTEPERPLKFRELLRREEDATAYWNPDVVTDADGKGSFTFKAPTTLTRWRITARGMSEEGVVGQKVQGFATQQDLFVKWTGPRRFRHGDKPRVTLVGFNLTGKEQTVKLEANGLKDLSYELDATMGPGSNFFPFYINVAAAGPLRTALSSAGKVVDALVTDIDVMPLRWVNGREKKLPPGTGRESVAIKDNVGNVELRFVNGSSAAFLRIVDDLLDYPYGCVEQTSSRLIPLAMALDTLKEAAEDNELPRRIRDRLTTERARLIAMAGPGAQFSWWGDQTRSDLFMTAYAYYADWRASQALGLTLPDTHWNALLDRYAAGGAQEPPLRRSLIVWMMARMGLPAKNLLEGVASGIVERALVDLDIASTTELDSDVLSDIVNSGTGLRQAAILTRALAKELSVDLPADFAGVAKKTETELRANGGSLLSKAILLAAEGKGDATPILDELRTQAPTIDRSLTLMIIEKYLRKGEKVDPATLDPGPEWTRAVSALGQPYFKHKGTAPQDVRVDWSGAKGGGVQAFLKYGTAVEEAAELQLPVRIKRRLFALTGDQKADGATAETPIFSGKPIEGSAWNLSSRTLYMDEITISVEGSQTYRNAVVDIPLTPGADVETYVGGITVKLPNEDSIDVADTRFETGDLAYSVPLDELKGSITLRHLVRFSQPGNFTIPRARFYRMYAPSAHAFEGRGESEFHDVFVH